jgi:hypothetical protein
MTLWNKKEVVASVVFWWFARPCVPELILGADLVVIAINSAERTETIQCIFNRL